MNIKKIISVILSLALVFCLFAGCAPTNEMAIKAPELSDLATSGIYSKITNIWINANAQYNEVPLNSALDGSEKNLKNLVKDFAAKADGSEDVSSAIGEAIAAIGTAEGYIHLNTGLYKLSADVTVPENVTLSFAPGAVISVDAGVTLTIDSKKIYAPLAKIFEGDGTVARMKNIEFGYPQWFGAVIGDEKGDSDAFQKAINCVDTVYLISGVYEIEKTVVIPQGRNISIIGQGQFNLSHLYISAPIAFSYLREAGSAKTDLYITGVFFKSDNANTAVSFHGVEGAADSSLKITNFIYHGLHTLVDMSYATGCEFADSRGVLTKYSFVFGKQCNDVVFGSFLSLSGGSFLVADGGDVNDGNSRGITFLNTCSVWAYASDVIIKNYSDISIKQGGYDLGCNQYPGTDNRAAIVLDGVKNVLFEGNWIATCPDAPYSAKEFRDGILITGGSENVKILGNSIVNNRIGVNVDNGTDVNANIEIIGNKGEGNFQHDFYLANSNGVKLNYNFCFSYRWRGIPHEISGGGNLKNIEVIGNSLGNSEYDLVSQIGLTDSFKCEHNLFKVST
ncbi:MAG: hypothetical protein IJD95_03170 [Clostridia bacterium]|nr:hypothetical protein [Clostridia bacterium]